MSPSPCATDPDFSTGQPPFWCRSWSRGPCPFVDGGSRTFGRLGGRSGGQGGCPHRPIPPVASSPLASSLPLGIVPISHWTVRTSRRFRRSQQPHSRADCQPLV